uniref:Ras-GEF domain-containing protein n=1 Tax=Globodera pallida TaxID=36090 RepID=A0A183CBP1_GLOPA
MALVNGKCKHFCRLIKCWLHELAIMKMEQKQYIKNFNFVLKLSEFSLSYYEVYKVLEAILIESNAASAIITNERPPAVHTFLKQHFISKLYRKSIKLKQYIRLKFGSNMNKVDCAFVHFGREMERRLEENSFISYPRFSEYVEQMEEEKCGEAPHNQNTQNTTDLGSKQLAMKLFHEPLWNYARAIQIDSHECKAVLQFADALRP